MTTLSKNFFTRMLLTLGLTLTMVVGSFAQDPSAEPPATAPTEASIAPAEVIAAAPTAEVTDEAETSDDLRRLDQPAEQAAASEETTQKPMTLSMEVSAKHDEEEEDAAEPANRRRGSAEEFPFGDHKIAAGSTTRELVSIFGNATLDGESEREVVSVFGNTTVNGRTGREAISIFGNTKVTGEVGGEAVAILGDVTLGPKAIVHRDVVVIGGRLIRAEGAEVHGSVNEVSFLGGTNLDWLKAWIYRCALWGRPLAFGQNLTWAWTIAIGVFAMYVFLALLFPRAFEKCVETFEQRPGYSLLAMLLSVLLTPVLIVLLAITGIGIILIPFVVAAIFFSTLFGKAVVHAWLGRRLTRYFGGGIMNHVAMAALVGSVIILLLYTVPFLGFFLWKVLGMLGLGIVIYTLILTTRKEAAVAGPAPTALQPPVVTEASAVGAAVASSLPRAGFWLRILATALDTIVVGIVAGLTHSGALFLLWFSIYHVAFWALRGTTIGGTVCGLKVVRLDDRPVDWIVALVRCLGAFLSLFVIGLGFVWVAFDKEKQSWHDKIAGTVIVRAPKGVSLL